ncbi:protein phosphatase CheZ [Magnetovibrio sp. PR-2]|uniref:protein phosphatase CheZ n=1 Tax=Magnetovibrio sp. PR-2 TaxID=3120356 RepID=UPI002FCE36A8
MAASKAKGTDKSKKKAKAKSKAKSVTKAKAKTAKRAAAPKKPSKTKKKSKSVEFQATFKGVYAELERLAGIIDAAKQEISDLRPHEDGDDQFVTASDQLDAVIEATADATNTIMDSCDVIEGVMGDVSPEVSAKLMDATTRIYEACSFQDITGQRIGKVVGALKSVEERIDVMVDTLGGGLPKPPAKPKKADEKSVEPQPVSDEDLLEGPQLGEKGKSQAEIDDLLASFD